MKKLKQRNGLTLMELLASLLVVTLLITAMGTCMESALKSYRDSLFTSDSGALASIVNTALEDLLRYARDVKIRESEIRFTNEEYGIYEGCIQAESGRLQIRDTRNGTAMEVLNSGVYGDLEISDLEMTYVPPGTDGKRGGYFRIRYTIKAWNDTRTRSTELTVRQLNP